MSATHSIGPKQQDTHQKVLSNFEDDPKYCELSAKVEKTLQCHDAAKKAPFQV